MAEGDASGGWYMRARGRVLGPLTWSQLRALRDRGQLARFHAVSRDRQNWVSAASLSQLFPNAEAEGPIGHAGPGAPASEPSEFIILEEAASGAPSSGLTASADKEDPAWFVTQGEGQRGPLRL